MLKADFADHIIENLNELKDLDPQALGALIEHRVACNEHLADSPTYQVLKSEVGYEIGLLGILNGMVGVIETGPKQGVGLITAVCDDNDNLVRFQRTTET